MLIFKKSLNEKDELKHVSDCVTRLARGLNKSFVNNVLAKNVQSDEDKIIYLLKHSKDTNIFWSLRTISKSLLMSFHSNRK